MIPYKIQHLEHIQSHFSLFFPLSHHNTNTCMQQPQVRKYDVFLLPQTRANVRAFARHIDILCHITPQRIGLISYV